MRKEWIWKVKWTPVKRPKGLAIARVYLPRGSYSSKPWMRYISIKPDPMSVIHPVLTGVCQPWILPRLQPITQSNIMKDHNLTNHILVATQKIKTKLDTVFQFFINSKFFNRARFSQWWYYFRFLIYWKYYCQFLIVQAIASSWTVPRKCSKFYSV